MRPRKNPRLNLADYVRCICPYCGSGTEDVVKYFKKHSSTAYREAYDLEDTELMEVLTALLNSNIDIFTKEYVELLNYAREHLKRNSDKEKAEGIYKFYKENFDKVRETYALH